MNRLLKLLPALALVAFALAAPTETRADPLTITSGTVAAGGAPFSRNAWHTLSINISASNSANNVSVILGVGDGDSRRAPHDSLSPNLTFSAEGIGQASVNGTNYTSWFYGRDTVMAFTGSSVIFPDDTNDAETVTLSTNFSMTGTLVIHDLFGRGDNPIVFSSPIIGQGTAFLTYTHLPNGLPGYELTSVSYEFTATPEPATLILLGTGLAGAATYRKRRKSPR